MYAASGYVSIEDNHFYIIFSKSVSLARTLLLLESLINAFCTGIPAVSPKLFLQATESLFANTNQQYKSIMKKLLHVTLLFLFVFSGITSLATIVGPAGVCVGDTVMLGSDVDTSGPGTWWSSSNPSVATVSAVWGASAVVTGHSAGTTIITFSGPSGISTFPFTVYTPPAPIVGGTSPFCVGTTTTLSNPTPGGVWGSSTSSVASVDGFTGVVTGLAPGMVTISYSVVPECAVTHVVTVNGLTTAHTVSGTAVMCPGTAATFTSTVSGGTWSSTNPAVATVDAATGVVTAITTGTANIVHTATVVACTGSFTASTPVTVSTTISAGTISGPATLTTGSGGTYTSTVAGGVWASSNPAVATISASGVVSALTVGTTTISYTVTSGSCTPATAVIVVTVTTPGCIEGTINFSGPAPAVPVKVLLIKYNPATLMLYSVAAQNAESTTGWTYRFCGLGTDSFRVKAFIDTITVVGTGHQPTYHNASVYWHSANVIYHITGTVDAGKDINMGYGTVSGGPGFVAGNVTTGANKGTADAIPAVGMYVFCVNAGTGAVLQQAITNSAGNYSFTGLPVGVPLTIYPEDMSYTTTPYPTITLTSAASSVTAANFKQSTLYRTIVPITSSVGTVATTHGLLSVYPNPATNAVTVQWANLTTTGVANITITDVTGRVVLTASADMNQPTGQQKLNIGQLAKGLYVLHVRGNDLNVTRKLEVE